MSAIFIREGEVSDREAWLHRLGISEPEFAHLLTNRILLRGPTPNLLRNNFVGVVLSNSQTIVSLPKFCERRELSFFDIVKLLRAYFARGAARNSVEDAAVQPHFFDEGVLRELDAYLGLVDWWREHGVYHETADFRGIGGGRPDWRRTLAQGVAAIVDGRPVYLHPISARGKRRYSQIGALQLRLIQTVGERYGARPSRDLDADLAASPVLVVDPGTVRGARHYLALVERERNKVFRSDRLRLLGLLTAMLDATSAVFGQDGLRVYGTTAFYAVWEDACRHYFRSPDAETLDGFAQPEWHLYREGQRFGEVASGEQRPDIAVCIPGHRLILDAKHYYPFPVSRPGWPDIVKQYYYSESLPQFDGVTVNAFLMPGRAGVEFEFAGFVRTSAVNVREFPDIEVWLVDPFSVLASYTLSGTPAPAALHRYLDVRAVMGELIGETEALIGV